MKSKIGSAAGSCKQHSRRQKAWRKQWQQRQARIDKHHREPDDGLSGEQPVLQGANVQCVMGERQCGTAYGGVANWTGSYNSRKRSIGGCRYNGTWGYHPLVVSLANTGEVLSTF